MPLRNNGGGDDADNLAGGDDGHGIAHDVVICGDGETSYWHRGQQH